MQYIIGLTGLMGSGKSLAASMFTELGVVVIDTDAIAHTITQKGGVALTPIIDYFGKGVLAANGGLDRVKMRRLVFSVSKHRMILERILHPLIFNSVVQQIKANQDKYLIVMVPLLFRAVKYLNLIHRSLFVDCTESAIIKRVAARSGLIANEIITILNTQMSREVQLQLCDDVIDNNGTISQLSEQVTYLNTKYRRLFGH